MKYSLLNKLTTKPGKRKDVVAILLEAGKLFDPNPSCLLYLVTTAPEPDVIWVLDLWTSSEDHEKALQAPELRPFIIKSMPLLMGMPEQIELNAVGGKGF